MQYRLPIAEYPVHLRSPKEVAESHLPKDLALSDEW
jgi:hypothetical protein